MDDLKPCPFCGLDAKIVKQHGKHLMRYHAIVCSEGCQIYSVNLDKAIEAWNKRAPIKVKLSDLAKGKKSSGDEIILPAIEQGWLIENS